MNSDEFNISTTSTPSRNTQVAIAKSALSKSISRARAMLYLVGAFQISLYAGVTALSEQEGLSMHAAIGIAEGIIYIALGKALHQRPTDLVSLALTLYLGDLIVWGIVDPRTIFDGIVVKVIMMAVLLAALDAARKYEALLQEADDEKAQSQLPN